MFTNIILDCGHGGLNEDGVYTTAPNKMFRFTDGEVAYEGHINRQIGRKLYEFLRWDENVKVHYTIHPDNPKDLSLKDRVKFINNFDRQSTLLVSIHCNAFNGKVRGFEIYTTTELTISDQVAEFIFNSVKTLYDKIALKTRPDLTDNDSDKEADFYVLINSKCPSVLVECLYFDNKEDYEMLKNQKFQTQLAYHIYLGIRNYINSKNYV